MTRRHIPTDLLTPLGAYLRLREGAGGELPARVGRAGTARPPLVHRLRLAARHASRRRKRSDEPVVGYLAYDHVAKLEPTVPLPADGPDLPESRFVVAETLVRFDHGSGTAEVLAGDPAAIAAPARGRACVAATQSPLAARDRCGASPTRPRTKQGVRRIKELHPRRRRVPGRALAARGAADLRLGARALPRAAARQPVAVPLPARARRARARRLLAGDARQVRGRPREPEPDRRHDPSRRGRRRAAARLREGPRRARDARRPRPQRPLARLQRRAPSASRASSSRSASRTSRTSSRR